jgi:hypothetical protein
MDKVRKKQIINQKLSILLMYHKVIRFRCNLKLLIMNLVISHLDKMGRLKRMESNRSRTRKKEKMR